MPRSGPSDRLSAPSRTEKSTGKPSSGKGGSTTSKIGSAASAQRNSPKASQRSSDRPPSAGGGKKTSQRSAEAPPHAQRRVEAAFYNADPSFVRAYGGKLAGESPYSTKNRTYSVSDTVGALENSPFNLVKTAGNVAGGIANIANNIYNDPVGTFKSGIAAIGDSTKRTYNQIANAASNAMAGNPEGIGPAFVSASSMLPTNATIGLATGAGLPANSIGSLIGRASSIPDIERAYKYGESALNSRRFTTPQERFDFERDLFEKTAKMTPEGVSGYQRIMHSVPGDPVRYGFEAYDPMEMRTPNVLDRVKSGVFGQNLNRMKYSEAMRPSLTQEAYPSLKNVPLAYRAKEGRIGNLGAYMPAGASPQDYYSGIGGLYNEIRDMVFPSRSMVGQPSIEVNSPIKPSLSDKLFGYSDPSYAIPTLAHEVGHYTSNLGNLYRGGSPYRFLNEIQSSSLTPNMDPQRARHVAFEAYETLPGEATSRALEQRINLPPEAMKNWDNRFVTSFSDEEVDRMKNGAILRQIYGLK